MRTLRALRSIRCGVVLGQVFWVAPITKKIAHHRGFGRIIVFGPQTFQRATGNPVTVTRTFAITGPLDGYTLRVVNRGVTSAVIALNGRAVLNPEDFKGRKGKDEEKDKKGDKDRDNKDSDKGKDKGRYDRDGDSDFVPLIERPVDLRAGNNQIAVELRGKPGASLTVEILRTAPLDTTPPTITATPNPPPNANGWNNTAVTVTFTCADAGSGIAICPAAVVVSGEGANQVISGTATAGNTAEASVTLNIDKTAPIVTASQSPDANARGWNNGPVVVTFAATDALSGVEPGTLSAPVTLSGDGANQSVPRQARDLAGNVGSVTRAGINIDQARPIITVALSPDPGPGGFAAVPVTAHFSCSDALSGVLTCPFDQVVGQEGSN